MKALGFIALVAAAALGLAWIIEGETLVVLAVVAFAVQWVAFPVAYAMRTERFYDLTGSLTYMALLGLALLIADELSTRAVILALCVAIWALRLGVFLARRVHRAGRDRRFDKTKHSPGRFAVAWSLQGLWVFLTPLAVWLVIIRPVDGLGIQDAVGLSVWVVGFGFELVADAQKSAFRRVAKNEGRFIQSGLWAWSRHPNYFGEIALWTGIFIAASSQLQGVEWLAVLSPVFVAILLVSGSGIPLLEADAEKRWGSDPEYQSYKEKTPVLFPWPPSR